MAAVVDASALVLYLVDAEVGPRVAAELARHDGDLHVPHLADVEVASVLRGLARAGDIAADRAAMALDDLADFPAVRWGHEALLRRVWSLRENISAYDATYVALAEGLGAALVTRDSRLASAASAHAACPVVLL
ncbi:MAG: type II toxin-antitoxin system VapC family toxin [Propionibacteriaceae bacterium]|jgi:predicted nucleic acid-binding protein|nr:type II toxin-antitoxin system VapC family toxin [Propionibacteriaceae bacterium]